MNTGCDIEIQVRAETGKVTREEFDAKFTMIADALHDAIGVVDVDLASDSEALSYTITMRTENADVIGAVGTALEVVKDAFLAVDRKVLFPMSDLHRLYSLAVSPI